MQPSHSHANHVRKNSGPNCHGHHADSQKRMGSTGIIKRTPSTASLITTIVSYSLIPRSLGPRTIQPRRLMTPSRTTIGSQVIRQPYCHSSSSSSSSSPSLPSPLSSEPSSSSEECYYFAYGSNLNQNSLAGRGIKIKSRLPATVLDPKVHLVFRHRGEAGPDVVVDCTGLMLLT